MASEANINSLLPKANLADMAKPVPAKITPRVEPTRSFAAELGHETGAEDTSKAVRQDLPRPSEARPPEQRSGDVRSPEAHPSDTRSAKIQEGVVKTSNRDGSGPPAPRDASRDVYVSGGKQDLRETSEQGGIEPSKALSARSDKLESPKNDAAGNGESPQKLQTLKKAAQAYKDDIAESPAIVFLSGRADALSPEQVPELTEADSFVAEALGERDVSDFFNRPMPLAELVKALGLPGQIVGDAQRFGIDPHQGISPSDLLRAIGVDPLRAVAELTNLKADVNQALQAAGAEGLAGDAAQRAQFLSLPNGGETRLASPQLPRKPLSAPRPFIGSGGRETSVNTSPGNINQPYLAVSGSFGTASLNSNLSANSIPPSIDLKKDDARSFSVVASTELSPTAILALTQGLVKPSTGLNDESNDQATWSVGERLSDKISAVLSPRLESQGGLAASQTALPFTLPPASMAETYNIGSQLKTDLLEKTALPASPSLHRATFDAFASLGDQLKSLETTRLDMTDPARQPDIATSIQDQSVMGSPSFGSIEKPTENLFVTKTPNFTAKSPALQAPLLASVLGTSDKTTGNSSRIVADLGPLSVAPNASPEDSMKLVTPSRFVGPSSFDAQKTLNASDIVPTPKIAADELRLSIPGMPAAQNNEEETPKREPDGFNPEKLASELFAAKPNIKGHAQATSFAQHVETPTLTPAQRAEMMQKVIDRATLMVKEGGGTVRLDLASPELGALEMAVSMHKGRLDMRILAGSDRVREAMVQDLGTLKNALSVQNVTLGNVEVGVGHRQNQQFAGFSGQGQPRQQTFAEARDERRPRPELDGGIQDIKRASLPKPALANVFRANPYNSLGRLAVRA